MDGKELHAFLMWARSFFLGANTFPTMEAARGNSVKGKKLREYIELYERLLRKGLFLFSGLTDGR